MTIKHISIFVANEPGRLAEVTKVLGGYGVNILALSIADTPDYGILRLITTNAELTEKALKQSDLTFKTTPVLGILVDHAPGGLSKALCTLAEAKISVEYLYAFVGKSEDSAMVIIKADDTEKAEKCLENAGIKLLSQSDVENM